MPASGQVRKVTGRGAWSFSVDPIFMDVQADPGTAVFINIPTAHLKELVYREISTELDLHTV